MPAETRASTDTVPTMASASHRTTSPRPTTSGIGMGGAAGTNADPQLSAPYSPPIISTLTIMRASA